MGSLSKHYRERERRGCARSLLRTDAGLLERGGLSEDFSLEPEGLNFFSSGLLPVFWGYKISKLEYLSQRGSPRKASNTPEEPGSLASVLYLPADKRACFAGAQRRPREIASAPESAFRLSWCQFKLQGVNSDVHCPFIQQILTGRPLSARHWGCPGGEKQLINSYQCPQELGARAAGADPALRAHPLPGRPARGCRAPPAQPSGRRRGTRPTGSSLEGLIRVGKAGKTAKHKKAESEPQSALGSRSRQVRKAEPEPGPPGERRAREREGEPGARGAEAAPAGGGRGRREGPGRCREGRAQRRGRPTQQVTAGRRWSRSGSVRRGRRGGEPARGLGPSLPEHGGTARGVQERGAAAAGAPGAVAAAAAAAAAEGAAMARWIPTKRQKYGVGECSPHPDPARPGPAAAKFAGAAQPGAKLGAGRRAACARAARAGVRLLLPSRARSALSPAAERWGRVGVGAPCRSPLGKSL